MLSLKGVTVIVLWIMLYIIIIFLIHIIFIFFILILSFNFSIFILTYTLIINKTILLIILFFFIIFLITFFLLIFFLSRVWFSLIIVGIIIPIASILGIAVSLIIIPAFSSSLILVISTVVFISLEITGCPLFILRSKLLLVLPSIKVLYHDLNYCFALNRWFFLKMKFNKNFFGGWGEERDRGISIVK